MQNKYIAEKNDEDNSRDTVNHDNNDREEAKELTKASN